MKRLLINGSPRGRESNSRLILSWMLEGMNGKSAGETVSADRAVSEDSAQSSGPEKMIICDLKNISKHDETAQLFADADEVIFIMPLYTDSMPAIVKVFFEKIGALSAEKLAGKRIFFIIQSGFPESIHSETLGAYCARFAARHNMILGGTILKGGIEGIRVMPEKMTRPVRDFFVSAGKEIAEKGAFSAETISLAANPRVFTGINLLMMKLISRLGINNFYWNMMLKKNNAYKKRFDAPYGEKY